MDAAVESLLAWAVSALSYRTCAFCLVSVPLTHALGVWIHCPQRSADAVLRFPFAGGAKHVALQLSSWVRRGHGDRAKHPSSSSPSSLR
jgi:hypothetical protein